MKILAIDTSSKLFSLAISDNGKVLKHRNFKSGKLLSSSIIPKIDKLIKSAGFELSNFDCFAVGLGPGTFTGLRIGLSTIKAFAATLKKPVVSVPSLDVIAMGIKDKTKVCVICDARRNLVYYSFYDKKDGNLKSLCSCKLSSIDEVIKMIDSEVVFVGDGINVFKKEIENGIKAQKSLKKNLVRFADEKFWFPKAKNLIYLAENKIQKKEFDDLNKLVPLYLYAQDCQVRK